MGRIFLIILLVSFSAQGVSQVETDTTRHKRQKREHPIDTSYHHNVKLATILSSVVPGAGQVYNEIGYRKYSKKRNRAWWKVPIIYGGLAVTGYYFKMNLDSANKLKKEYLYQKDNPGSYWHPEYQYYSSYTLTTEYDKYAEKRDLFVFITLGVYGLQIIEALVDAHFVTFDVSQNLTLNWSPILLDRNTAGLRVGIMLHPPTRPLPSLRF